MIAISRRDTFICYARIIERGYDVPDERCFDVKKVKGEMRKSQLFRFGATREFLSNSRDEAI